MLCKSSLNHFCGSAPMPLTPHHDGTRNNDCHSFTAFSSLIHMCVYMYIRICVYICTYVYVYIYVRIQSYTIVRGGLWRFLGMEIESYYTFLFCISQCILYTPKTWQNSDTIFPPLNCQDLYLTASCVHVQNTYTTTLPSKSLLTVVLEVGCLVSQVMFQFKMHLSCNRIKRVFPFGVDQKRNNSNK